jgi:mRNA interferase RelE/StbE
VGRYKLFIKPSAVREIEGIDRKADRQRIIRRIRDLTNEPRPPGSEKVSGRNQYRVRQGRYRIVYSIEDDNFIVCVVKVGHRKDVYR